ncbi:hypothetical protein KZX37_00385 [Microbacterium sp. EYE_5]|uniref:hypothetical protein n=1 Tax=unclassified Microbacterium TaxID=2609290 RepID=UPI002005F374|nr:MULTISPECIES: hypothetical protein [unclassified Microbacterium]MCK6079070.1 hypothetical protein [Microbacterium sp. EYE_382]MCK6084340.1 hypothetical protein [Microbacterium sp. EYE_384]MCK6123431.1 hypothetical protein [Microbacterium sp. EYE_80]MCK6125104.1 hypothetical protein [Microbacterium sp. EYE_79]MCK6140024.1 hypothetical protein [Microbacterium sp. EYE_39]
MKNKISKAAAALVVAAAAVFAAPAVASADVADGYTPSAPGDGTVTIAPGESGTFPFSGFEPNETVTFTLTGAGVTDDSLAFVALSASTDSTTEVKDANDEGVASATVTLPDNASGTYTLSAEGETSGAADDVTITVAATGGAGGGGLPSTGFEGDALLGLWVGGGLLVLAGASIAVATSVRRTRQSA